MSIQDFDPIRNILKLDTKATRNTKSTVGNMTLLLGSNTPHIMGARAKTFSAGMSITVDGDCNLYPFDVFTTDIPYLAASGDPAMENVTVYAWSAYAYAQIQTFRFELKFDTSKDDPNIVNLNIAITRSPTTRAFSMLVLMTMWTLTLAAVSMAFQVFLRGRDVVCVFCRVDAFIYLDSLRISPVCVYRSCLHFLLCETFNLLFRRLVPCWTPLVTP